MKDGHILDKKKRKNLLISKIAEGYNRRNHITNGLTSSNFPLHIQSNIYDLEFNDPVEKASTFITITEKLGNQNGSKSISHEGYHNASFRTVYIGDFEGLKSVDYEIINEGSLVRGEPFSRISKGYVDAVDQRAYDVAIQYLANQFEFRGHK